MKLELLPLLEIQRDLHTIPPGPARFEAYVKAVTGGGHTIVAPLANMNPMGKEHVAELIDDLLARDAEMLVAEVLAKAENRLGGLEDTLLKKTLQVGLVLTDDHKGGWTNRYLTDMTQRFKNGYDLEHGWALVPVWTSQVWTADALEQAVLSTVYRTLYKKVHGLPVTLREVLKQEGRALHFAGATLVLASDDLVYSRAVLEPYKDATEWAVILPCLYGDAAAKAVGHPPLGLSPNAGYAVALDDARRDADPVTALSPLTLS
ncbi:hypothetical protein BH24DEI2_BH24DEI2_22540 [soil metagenome]